MRFGRRAVLRGLLGLGVASAGLALVGPDGVTPLRLVASAAGEPSTTPGPRLQPLLEHRAGQAPGATYRVIIQRRSGDRRADQAVAAAGQRKLRDLTVDGFVAEVVGHRLAALAANPSIRYISLDSPMLSAGTVDSGQLATLYPWSAQSASGWGTGVTGAGVGVAVLDTGITPRADFNTAQGLSRIVAGKQFNDDSYSLADGYGHGTHVAGIIAGNSWMGTGSVGGRYIGTAPEANLINVKVADFRGHAYASDLVDAIEWVIQNRVTYNIRVMNISLVQSEPESYLTSILCASVERAWFSGIFVVVSSGNAGPATASYPPANDPFVVTVGASDPASTGDAGNDFVAPWSSYGITQDGFIKPDIVTTGRYVTSVVSYVFAPLFSGVLDRIVDRNYIWLSGTSMAAAAASGAAAQVFQMRPHWTNDQLKMVLKVTARPLGSWTRRRFSPYPGQGAGALQVAGALSYNGVPNSANQGIPISAQLVGPGGALTYNNTTSSSWSGSSWSGSSWSGSSWSGSSWSSSSWSSSSWTTAGWASTLD